MTLTRRVAPPAGLSAEDEQLLRDGPPSAPMPSQARHDALRRLWAVRGAQITATTPRGRRPWFVQRDWFVRIVRGDEEV